MVRINSQGAFGFGAGAIHDNARDVRGRDSRQDSSRTVQLRLPVVDPDRTRSCPAEGHSRYHIFVGAVIAGLVLPCGSLASLSSRESMAAGIKCGELGRFHTHRVRVSC